MPDDPTEKPINGYELSPEQLATVNNTMDAIDSLIQKTIIDGSKPTVGNDAFDQLVPLGEVGGEGDKLFEQYYPGGRIGGKDGREVSVAMSRHPLWKEVEPYDNPDAEHYSYMDEKGALHQGYHMKTDKVRYELKIRNRETGLSEEPSSYHGMLGYNQYDKREEDGVLTIDWQEGQSPEVSYKHTDTAIVPSPRHNGGDTSVTEKGSEALKNPQAAHLIEYVTKLAEVHANRKAGDAALDLTVETGSPQ